SPGTSRLPSRGLAPLAAGGLLLRRGPALLRAAAAARRRAPGLLASAAGGPRRVRDLGRALLRHALLAKTFVLLLVLDAGSLARHRLPPSVLRYRAFARSHESLCRPGH